MRVAQFPMGRCRKAIHGECERPCKKYLAHHIVPRSWDWCICEPVTRPPEFKSWAAYNRMLMFRLNIEGKLVNIRHYHQSTGTFTNDMGLPAYP